MNELALLAASGGATQKTYVDDVFSAYLYNGNSSTQTINNGIDLAGKGGLVWLKSRTTTFDHYLQDTARGADFSLASNTTGTSFSSGQMTSFNSNGFTLSGFNTTNGNSQNFVGFSFRKAPKFFDVVTYTGNGSNRTIAHALGQEVGLMFVKRTDTTADWQVYHRSLANTEYAVLNTTAAKATGATRWNSATPTTSVFSVGTDTTVNATGGTYVAYLFAHDTGTDGLIQCGSFTTDGSGNATVNLGWEPQFVLFKGASGTNATGDPWGIGDAMRGMNQTNIARLIPNASNAEDNITFYVPIPTATGFIAKPFAATTTYIYLAIRRPNKPPTTGTQVFAPITYAGNSTANTPRTTGFVTDMVWSRARANVNNEATYDRLRGAAKRLGTTTADAETAEVTGGIGLSSFASMTGYIAWEDQGSGSINVSGRVHTNWSFRRAPGFFDVVCRAGTGAVQATVSHNLAVAPELIIGKVRSNIRDWVVYFGQTNRYLNLNSNLAQQTDAAFMTSVSATNFVTGTSGLFNENAETFIYYLFASLPGISKVGSYTGNGTSQTIPCGFTTGARFILIKRTDSTGDWYVWDSARGIVAANDPHLSLNSTAAEVTTNDSVDPDTSGFILNQVAATNINVSAGTYIFLAIA